MSYSHFIACVKHKSWLVELKILTCYWWFSTVINIIIELWFKLLIFIFVVIVTVTSKLRPKLTINFLNQESPKSNRRDKLIQFSNIWTFWIFEQSVGKIILHKVIELRLRGHMTKRIWVEPINHSCDDLIRPVWLVDILTGKK